MNKKLLLFLVVLFNMFSLLAQTTCVGPTNLTANLHVPDYRHVTLDWQLAADSLQERLSLSDPMLLSSRVGWNGGGAATVVPTVRFLPADLAAMHGQRITAVSFAPGVSTAYASYSIVIWQGGGMSPIDSTLFPGVEIYNEPVTCTLVPGAINTVPLATPITIDSSMELWVGIHINTLYGYPIYVTTESDNTHQGQNLVSDETHNNWDFFSLSDGEEANFVIALEVTSSSNLVQGYKIYRNQTLITPTPMNNRSYVDTILVNGVFQYDVTAIYSNGCESAPVSASVTMEDDTCFIFDLPFAENFDQYPGTTAGAVSNLPECWHHMSGTLSSHTGYPIVYNSTTYSESGRNSLRFYTTNASADYGYQVAILPPIDVNSYPINTLQIEFDGRANAANNNFTIVVGVMDNYYDFSTFQPVDTFTNTTTTYSSHTTFFDQYTGSGSYIALMAPRTIANNYGYIDNIVVSEIPSCPKPVELTVTGSTMNSVTLAWNELGDAQEWEVEYGPTGFLLGTGNKVQTYTTTATISGLSPSAYYSFYARSICTPGDTSTYSKKVDKAMDCGPLNGFPYVQNFDAFSGASQTSNNNNLATFCWTQNYGGTMYSGCPLVYNSAANAQSGSNALYFNNAWTDAYTDQFAISPQIDPSIPISSLMLEFSAKRTTYPFLIVIGVMDNPADASTFTALDTMYLSIEEPNTYKDFLYLLNGYTGNGHYIALKNVKPSDYQTYNTGYIDDIVISQIPTCVKPSFVTVTNTTNHEVTIDWVENSNENTWEVVVVPLGSSPASGTVRYAYSHPFTVDQLQASTEYDVYVRSVCDDNETSPWSSKTSFKTRCEYITTLPYTMSFDSDGTATSTSATSPGPMVACWDRYTDNTAPYPYISSAQHSSGVGSLYMYSTSVYYSVAVSQPFDLSSYPADGVFMKYKVLKDNASAGRLQVGITTNPDSSEAFVVLDDIFGSDLPDLYKWYERSVMLPGSYDSPVYLVFRSPKGTTSPSYIDDIVVDEVVECSEPRQLSYEQLAPTSVLITWQPAFFGANGYEIDYAVSGTQNWSNPETVEGNSYRLYGLTPNTTYDVRVSTICSNGSSLSDTLTFQTCCLAGGDAVFENGVTQVSNLPVNNAFRYSYTQQIFDASELNGASVINSVSFYYAFSTPLAAKNNVDIYLAHTNKSSFNSSLEDYISNSNFQLVYSGALNCTQGWNTFTFTQPFQYDGVHNLLLVVDDNSGNYNSSSYTFLAHYTTPEYKALCYYNSADITPNNPEANGNVSSTRTMSRSNVIFGSVCDNTWYCLAPRVWVDSVNSHSIKLSWVPGYQENLWALEYKTDQELFWTTIGQSNTNSYTVTNLTENTNYEFRVCAVCSASDSSDWVTVTAHTPCTAVSLPYYQGFESATGSGATQSVDGCLTRITSNTQTAYPYPNGSYAYEGNYSLYFYGSASNYSCMALPQMENSVRMDSLLIQFRALRTAANYNIEVGIMTDPYDITTFTRLGTFMPAEESSQNNQKWDLGEIVTTGYTGNGRYVAFRTQQWLQSYIYIDDIRVDFIPSCRHVNDIQVQNVLPTSAEVSWTPGQDEQAWVYVCGPKGQTDPMTSSWQTATQSSITLTNLQPNTEYDIFVAADCGGATPSQFMKRSFITACMIVSTLPYSENFDSYGGVSGTDFFPHCWVRNGTYNAAQYPYLYNVYYNTPPSSLYFYSQGNTFSMAVTNEFDASIPMNTLQVSFYYRSSSPSHRMEVGVLTDPDNPSTFTPLDTVNCHNSETFEYLLVSFANYTGNGHYIAFKGMGTPYMSYIDDVWVEEISNCFNPTLSVSNVTTTEALIHWTPGEDETQWEVTVVPTGSTLEGTTPHLVQNDTFYLATGLNASTTYDVYLRGICPNNAGYTGYVMISFTTMCQPLALPYQENFDSEEGTTSSTVNNLPTCWRYYNQGHYYSGCPLVYKNATYAASGINSMQFYTYTTTSYTEQYAIMPEFDTTSTPLTSLELTFDARAYAVSSSFNLIIGVMSDPLDVFSFVPVDTFTINSIEYETFHVFFNSYTGNGKYITFMAPRFMNPSYNYGFVDNIEVKPMPNCMPIRRLMVSHITSTSAELSWLTNGSENSWDIQYRVANSADTTWFDLSVSDTSSTTITSLLPNTLYEVRMRANCGQGEYSIWSAVEYFRTECSPINQLPFSVDFDNLPGTTSVNENNLPVCWHYLNNGTSYGGYPCVYSNSSHAASGSNSIRFYVHTSTLYGDQYAILPSVETTVYPMNTLKISFDARKYASSYDSFNLLVGVMSDPYDASTFEVVDSVVIPETTFANYTTYFHNYTGNGSYIALKATKIATINYNAGTVDNITVASAPLCLPVQSVAVTNVTSTSMDISWVPLGQETEWVLKYTVDTVGGPVDSVVVSSTPFYALSNLSPNTPYKLEIKSNCSDDAVSVWSTPVYVVTECAGINTLPFMEDFSGYTHTTNSFDENNLPDCWNHVDQGSSASYYPIVYYNSTYAQSQPYSLRFYASSSSSYSDQYAILPVIDVATIPINTLQLSFGARKYNSSYPFKPVVGVMEGTDVSTFIVVDTVEVTSMNYDTYSVNFHEYSGSGNRIVIVQFQPDYSYMAGNIDDIVLDLIPCMEPESLSVSNVGANSADVTWTPVGAETAWNLQYKTDSSNWTLVSNLSVPSYTLTNLQASTAYQVQVQAACGEEESDWTSPVSFTTMDEQCVPPVNLHLVDTTNVTATLDWSQSSDMASEWTVSYRKASEEIWSMVVANTHPYELTNLEPGVTYTAQVVAHCANGLFSDPSEAITFTTSTVGVEHYELSLTEVYPNPTTGTLTIQNPYISIQSVEVYDVYGQLVMRVEEAANRVTLDVSNCAPGVYFTRIRTDKGVLTRRVVKQ